MSDTELGALIERAAQGDQAAFRELYRRFRPSVRRVAQGFPALGPSEVEDVVQETFVRAFKELPRLRHPQAFSHWLVTIARHHALALSRGARSQAQATETLSHEQAQAAPALPESLARERRAAVVRSLIAQLPEGPEQQTAQLFYVEGELSAREIAEKLGLGKSAITMRLERFRARVKRELLGRLLASEVE